jgi:hypothetical protein
LVTALPAPWRACPSLRLIKKDLTPVIRHTINPFSGSQRILAKIECDEDYYCDGEYYNDTQAPDCVFIVHNRLNGIKIVGLGK